MHALSTKNLILVAITLGVFLILLLPTLLLAEETKPAKIEEGAWYESILWTFVNGFFGLLVWIAGTLLNIAVGEFVVGFGKMFTSQGLGFAVDHLWGLVRDIFNLAFIFGLVYIGFKLILRTGESSAKSALVSIILAALLVNFSLFFAKAIVDFSNIAAAQIAHGFYDGVPGEYKVSDKFMNVLGLSGVWSAGSSGNFLENMATGKGNGLGYIFGTMILFIITAFVFFAGALLLLIRFVVLNFYLILSPLMFLGWVFPNLKSHAQDYWTGFLNQAFLAPVYLLMLYFAYYILKEFQNLTATNKDYAVIFSGNDPGQNINIIPFFVITCVFLLAAVSVAKKMSQKTAVSAVQTAASWADSTSRSVTGKYAFGLPSWTMRSTAGRGGNLATSNNNRLGRSINRVAEGSGFKAWTARRVQDVSNKMATSSYDTRHVMGLGKKLDLGATGIGGFNNSAGGYNKRLSDRNKAETERARKYAYNDQVYDDYGVRDELNTYNNLIEERRRVFTEMARSNDEAERQRLSILVGNTQRQITAMEEGRVLNPTGTPEEQARQTERMQLFREARTQANSNYGMRLYAANLASKYTGLPGGSTPLNIGRGEREDVARHINTEAGRTPNERLVRDLLTPAPAPQNQP